MTELRWRYKLNVCIEETWQSACNSGFSVRMLEGQSRTNEELYPLNQIEIKGWDLSSKVKVIVSPTVTQVYFYIENIPEINELENIAMDLGKVEQILNEVVVFAPDETARFSMETKIPVTSPSMLKTECMLKEKIHRASERLYELVLSEISLAHILLAEGKIGYALKRMGALSSELLNFQRNLIQWAKEQGIAEAEKWERELLASERFEAELASARSPMELRNLLEKYWSKGFDFGN